VIANKIMNFLKNARKKVPMSQVLRERSVAIPMKLVFKIKDEQDGSKWYKACIMTKGFLMIPGVDYTESFLPVTTETGVQCVIGISLHFINEDIILNIPVEKRWILEVYDVEAAFLNANPGGGMYIKIPDEMVELGFMTKIDQELFAILLDQNMYGNMDAALQFFEKYSRILVMDLGFIQSQTDPCIFFRHNEAGRLSMVISTHIDDSLIGGRKWQVEEFFKQFMQYLNIERLGQLKKHLRVWWEWKEDPQTGEVYSKASMSKMVQEIKEAYAEAMGKPAKPAKTPGYPGKCLKKSMEEEEEVRTMQYQSIVGKLMHYMMKV